MKNTELTWEEWASRKHPKRLITEIYKGALMLSVIKGRREISIGLHDLELAHSEPTWRTLVAKTIRQLRR